MEKVFNSYQGKVRGEGFSSQEIVFLCNGVRILPFATPEGFIGHFDDAGVILGTILAWERSLFYDTVRCCHTVVL